MEQPDKIVVSPKKYKITIKGVGATLMSRMLDAGVPKSAKKEQAKQDPLEREHQIWRDKMYYTPELGVHWPAEAIHQMLQDGAKYWGATIPGEGKKTYTAVLKAAAIPEDLDLGISSKEDPRIVPFGRMVNGNPSRGKKSGQKVYKIRPMIHDWQGSFVLHVFDARLTPDVLSTILNMCGKFVGLSDWRPLYGRFDILKIEDITDA